MSSVMSAITRTVPITQFNRGFAGKIFDEIKRTGAKVVMKNNLPEAVILPTDQYIREQEELEDLRLWKAAIERYENSNPANYISMEEVDRKFGFSAEALENVEVELE